MVALLGLTGCGGKVRISSKVMCEAHGGTYDPKAKTCAYKAQTLSVRQACQEQGGYYDDVAEFCEMGPP
jgi:hypothetical protein